MGKLDKFMKKFSKWFASAAGVLQTFIVVMVWVIVEQSLPKLDPNGFILLYVLTIYSSITQPILAYAASLSALESGKANDLLLAHDEKIEKLIEVNNMLLDKSILHEEAMMKMIKEISRQRKN